MTVDLLFFLMFVAFIDWRRNQALERRLSALEKRFNEVDDDYAAMLIFMEQFNTDDDDEPRLLS